MRDGSDNHRCLKRGAVKTGLRFIQWKLIDVFQPKYRQAGKCLITNFAGLIQIEEYTST
jgi:hypothetical protein